MAVRAVVQGTTGGSTGASGGGQCQSDGRSFVSKRCANAFSAASASSLATSASEPRGLERA